MISECRVISEVRAFLVAFVAVLLAASVSVAETALPTPSKSSNRFSKVVGWPQGKTPTAPAGFTVQRFAEQLDNPRWLYQLSNGDIIVAEARTEVGAIAKLAATVTGKSRSTKLNNSANRLTLLRDSDGDGRPELRETFLEGIKQPFGMLVLGEWFYVAGTDRVVRFPYKSGQLRLEGKGEQILELPAGGYNNHWTRNLIASPDGKKIYISVGSGSNVAEHGMDNEIRRANILEINPDGSGERVFASGLRNPVGMDWEPVSKKLWTAVNERDELGDELVPDYITAVKDGGFYGWPYSYFGTHLDPRFDEDEQRPDLVARALVPDLPLGAHTASLGLAFYRGKAFAERYHGGAFIAQHGSWNHSNLVGYKVVFVPFTAGRPNGPIENFLTGFIAEGSEVYGRPVGLLEDRNGALLVADDAGNTVWRVSAK